MTIIGGILFASTNTWLFTTVRAWSRVEQSTDSGIFAKRKMEPKTEAAFSTATILI